MASNILLEIGTWQKIHYKKSGQLKKVLYDETWLYIQNTGSVFVLYSEIPTVRYQK